MMKLVKSFLNNEHFALGVLVFLGAWLGLRTTIGTALKWGFAAGVVSLVFPAIKSLLNGITSKSGGFGATIGKAKDHAWTLLVGLILLVPAVVSLISGITPGSGRTFWFYTPVAFGCLLAFLAWVAHGGGTGPAARRLSFALFIAAIGFFVFQGILDRVEGAKNTDLHLAVRSDGSANLFTDPWVPTSVRTGDEVVVRVLGGRYKIPLYDLQMKTSRMKEITANGDPSIIYEGRPFGMLLIGVKPEGEGFLPISDEEYEFQGPEKAVFRGRIPTSSRGEALKGDLGLRLNLPEKEGVKVKAHEGELRVRITVNPGMRRAEATDKLASWQLDSAGQRLMFWALGALVVAGIVFAFATKKVGIFLAAVSLAGLVGALVAIDHRVWGGRGEPVSTADTTLFVSYSNPKKVLHLGDGELSLPIVVSPRTIFNIGTDTQIEKMRVFEDGHWQEWDRGMILKRFDAFRDQHVHLPSAFRLYGPGTFTVEFVRFY